MQDYIHNNPCRSFWFNSVTVVQKVDIIHGGVNWDSAENEYFVFRISRSFLAQTENGVACEER